MGQLGRSKGKMDEQQEQPQMSQESKRSDKAKVISPLIQMLLDPVSLSRLPHSALLPCTQVSII